MKFLHCDLETGINSRHSLSSILEFFSKRLAMKLKSPSKYTFPIVTIASNYCSEEGKKTWGFEIRCILRWFYEKTHKREPSGEPMHVTFVVSWPTFFDENQKYKKIYGLVHDCFNYHKRWTYIQTLLLKCEALKSYIILRTSF